TAAQASSPTLHGRARGAVNERLIARGLPPLPHVTPHTLRRTYVSIMLVATNFDVTYVQHQVGHAESRMTLDVYAHLLDRRKRDIRRRVAPDREERHPLGARGLAALSRRRRLRRRTGRSGVARPAPARGQPLTDRRQVKPQRCLRAIAEPTGAELVASASAI